MAGFSTILPTPSEAIDSIKSAANAFVTSPLPYNKLPHPQLSFWQWALVAIASMFVWRILKVRVFTPLAKIPGPFWETIFAYRMYKSLIEGNFHDYLLEQQLKYGPVFYFAKNKVCVGDPEDARYILGKKAFIKSKTYNTSILGAPNIFTTKDPKFNEMRRRQIGPAFTVSHIAEMEKTIHNVTAAALKEKIETLMDQTERQTGIRQCKFNYVNDFNYMSFDVISELAFGESFGMLRKGNYRILEQIHSTGFLAAIEATIPITLDKEFLMKKSRKDARELAEFTRGIIQKRIRENQEKGKPEKKDILQIFIDSVDKETGNRMSVQEIVSENIILLFAGTDTASSTMSWTLFLLMVYPDIYKKVVQEVRSAFPNPKSNIKYSEARSKLPYLEAVIYESMRLQAAVPTGLGRTVPKGGAEFHGHKIPGGTTVYVFIHGLHRNPQYWDQPNKFIPERFLGEGAAARKRNMFGFSTGYRICSGRNLAWTEIFLTMSRLLRDYDFELPKDTLYGPDVIDPKTGEPKIMPGRLGLAFGPRHPDRDGWIIAKPADLSAFSIPVDNTNTHGMHQSSAAYSGVDGNRTPLTAVSTTSTLV
ncbi:hypothetical protein H4219_003553 [Mycoemilia scoparia]|uniref:Cytochrome P450 n=1 Tax=Mycoemilia scoparia TaxID=417184 RepID=A0A9W7ZYG8_9FUNG|nr:hypothetical protein H4219_003553 [Mycoemilia scoparia]